MKKYLFFILLVFVTSIIISCRPSVVTDAKIEAKYSYVSDQDAIIGVFLDVEEYDRIMKENDRIINFANKDLLQSIGYSRMNYFFEEEKEIGEWLKIKFGLEIRKGEVIKIIYTYKGENKVVSFVYKPYNNDIFPKNIISYYDFFTTLSNNGGEFSANDRSSQDKLTSNNSSSSSQSSTSTSTQDKPTSNNNSSSSQNTQTSTNRLANTKWQSIDYQEVSITFGQNSFSLKYGGVISGSYTISGDVVNFSYIYIGHNEGTGALIGNELTAFGYVFRCVE
jgi:hypothetical protein